MEQQNFIDKHASAVVRQANSGQLPSVIMAQMILESNWGKSLLSSKYKNFFGYKRGSSWKGEVVNLDTGEVYDGQAVVIKDYFRVYNSAEESIADRVSLINRLRIYDPVRQATTPEGQAQALQTAGYATDPGYAAKLIQLINQYNLTELDKKKSS